MKITYVQDERKTAYYFGGVFQVPLDYTCISIDKDGEIYAFSESPQARKDFWYCERGVLCLYLGDVEFEEGDPDWKDTLVKI